MAKRGRPPKNPTPETETTVNNATGPSVFQRDNHGLLKNIRYVFAEDGSVNWRSMVKPEHLFPNKGWFEMRNKDVPSSPEGLRDDQLLIKLGGIKELARLRGFTHVSYSTQKCELDHVAVTCRITFIPNYETEGKEVSFQDMANASLNNTHDFGQNFLETIACNRAFVRCIRNFLNIHIVGADEIGKVSTPTKGSSKKMSLSPQSMLDSVFDGDFEEFKSTLREFWQENIYKNDAIKTWNGFSDIPTKEARVLLKLVKEH